MTTLKIAERQHLRGALGRMWRDPTGRIVVNSNPDSRTAMRRNANHKTVQALVARGLLVENSDGFEVTDAGRAALAGVA